MSFIYADTYASFDGVTDDYSDLQTAVNAAVGNTLVLPSGTALLSQNLVIPSGIKIVGVAGQTWLKPYASNTSSPLLIDIDSEENIYIDGVGFDGDILNITGMEDSVTVTDSARVVFDNCKWIDTKGRGVLFTSVDESGVKNSRFKDCGLYHLTSLDDGDRRQAIAYTGGGYGNFAKDNVFDGIGLDSISIGSGGSSGEEGFDVSNNKIKSGHAGSIYIAGAHEFICTNNYVSNGSTGGNGIDIFFSKDGVVSNNVCNGNGASGILLADVERTVVSGNTCKNNWAGSTSTHKGGITLHATSTTGREVADITITGNFCDDDRGDSNTTQLYGVYVIGEKEYFKRVKIDNSNHLVGRFTDGDRADENALYNPNAINITEFPQLFLLDDNATRTLCTDQIRGELVVINLNSSHYCLASLRLNQPPDQLLDPSSHFASSDAGSGVTALYRSSTTTNIVLKNRTGLDGRAYMVYATAMVDRD